MSCLRTYLTSVALTAMASQDETSELFIGEWMELRGVRSQMVVATKVRVNPSQFERGSGH